jgi:hypothetical protein
MSDNNYMKSYMPLLCRLASYSDREDFAQIFKTILEKSGIGSSMNFLLKMELKRLQKPSNTMVDLRGHVDEDCEAYIHNDVTHYFDDIAKAIFEEQISNFGGYTIGVYEQVTNTANNYRVMHQKEKMGIKTEIKRVEKVKNKSDLLFDTLKFNNFHIRKEERMHYVSDVFSMENNVEVHIGRSIDISTSGCQLKVAKGYNPADGTVIDIVFKKLQEEFQLGDNTYLRYEIVNFTECKESEDYNILRLKRITCEKTKRFDEFLSNYIIGNKRRYKINLDNTVDSVYSRGYSQYSLPRNTDLNLFIKDNGSELMPFMAIATETNRSTMEYWKDATNNLSVQNAITSQRLNFLKSKLNNGVSDSYLYVFSGINSSKDVVFYAALNEEFEGNNDIKNFFCGLGIDKYDFKVFSLSFSNASDKLAYQPFSLLTDDIKIFKDLNKKPPARVMSMINGLSHVLSIRDITTEETKEDYLNTPKISMVLADIKKFKCLVNKKTLMSVVPIKTLDIRKENRYRIKTPATIDFSGNMFQGRTIDLSTKGLKIKLSEPSEIKKGSIIKISLPKYNLVGLEYKIVHVNDELDEISLMVHGDVIEHKGRIYLRDLFNKNKNNLLNYQSGTQDSELSICVQNILSTSSTNMTAYFQKTGKKNDIQKVSLGTNDFNLTKDLTDESQINLGFLLRDQIYKDLVNHDESKKDKTSFSDGKNIYISIEKNGEVNGYLESQLTGAAMKKAFIKRSMMKGKFYCLNVSYSKAGRPDMSRIGTELNYISVYATHKGKEIEDDLWKINGVADIKDITAEVISRSNLNIDCAA